MKNRLARLLRSAADRIDPPAKAAPRPAYGEPGWYAAWYGPATYVDRPWSGSTSTNWTGTNAR